jgi:hypothetical protein
VDSEHWTHTVLEYISKLSALAFDASADVGYGLSTVRTNCSWVVYMSDEQIPLKWAYCWLAPSGWNMPLSWTIHETCILIATREWTCWNLNCQVSRGKQIMILHAEFSYSYHFVICLPSKLNVVYFQMHASYDCCLEQINSADCRVHASLVIIHFLIMDE